MDSQKPDILLQVKLALILNPLVKSSCLFDLQINLAMSISVAFAYAN